MNKFAVFDIDGTLIRWQLYHVVVDRLAKDGQLSTDASNQLRDARMSWKRREHLESFAAYEKTLISIYEACLPKIDPKHFDALIDSIISEYKEQVYRYTRELIQSLKDQGYVLLAISGSHHELVAEIAKFYGFDDWIGTTYTRTEAGYSGEKFVASHHKQKLLEQFMKKHHLTIKDSYAIGDSKSDAPMLEMVEHPIAFNPDKSLFTIASQKGWDIVIERKNVVYTLQFSNGSYVLAETGK